MRDFVRIWRPAVRLVAVHLWTLPLDEGLGVDFYPVVGLQSIGSAPFRDDGFDLHHEAIIVVDGLLCTVRDAASNLLAGQLQVVACPWSPAEDLEGPAYLSRQVEQIKLNRFPPVPGRAGT